MKKILTMGIVLMLALSACYKDKEELLYPNEFNNSDTTAVTYAGYVKPLLDAKCGASCHPGYMNYAGLKVVVDNGNFNNRVLVKKDMPPAGALSATDLAKLKKWLDAGAPNN
jgi:hypothetical protein